MNPCLNRCCLDAVQTAVLVGRRWIRAPRWPRGFLHGRLSPLMYALMSVKQRHLPAIHPSSAWRTSRVPVITNGTRVILRPPLIEWRRLKPRPKGELNAGPCFSLPRYHCCPLFHAFTQLPSVSCVTPLVPANSLTSAASTCALFLKAPRYTATRLLFRICSWSLQRWFNIKLRLTRDLNKLFIWSWKVMGWIVTNWPSMYHLRTAMGLDGADVQLSATSSPGW